MVIDTAHAYERGLSLDTLRWRIKNEHVTYCTINVITRPIAAVECCLLKIVEGLEDKITIVRHYLYSNINSHGLLVFFCFGVH